MKFTDGYWLTRPGVTVLRPRHIDEVTLTDRGLVAYAATAPLLSRSDTLNRPVLTIELDVPAEGVLSVTITHHAGTPERSPRFALTGDASAVDVTTGEHGGRRVALIRTGPLTARVATEGEWFLDLLDADGQVLTSSTSAGMGIVSDAEGRSFVREQLGLGVGEYVYGLGERFTAFVKNGQSVDIWNADGGTASDQAYKNVPFYLTNRGYGVLVDHPGRVSYEVGSEAVSRVQFSVEGQRMRYLVVAGPTPKDVLRRYTALSGRPARVPAWSHGLWLSTSFTTDYDEATVTSFVDGMAERDIPLSVFHFDCFWMRQFHWTDLVWDPAVFPDPEGMLGRLKARGLRVSAWVNPYIAQRSRLFAEGCERGFLVRRPDGSVWQWDMWQAGMGLVDFTNPDAKAWFQDHLRVLLGQGVDAVKTDFGERVPTDVVWADGSDPERMHNYYTHLYNEAVFELLEAERGKGEAVLFARSATAGGQRFPIHWGGDCESTFASMAESLRGGLSLAMSGFGYWSHDIGGFEGTPDPEVFKRWLAFGLLSSHSRLHGSDSYRVPWAFDDEAVEVARRFTHLKLSLMPYLARIAEEAHTQGLPMMRPMVLEVPDDPGAATVETQYMLGDALLVAPVFSADGIVDVYVPAGTWTHLLTNEQVTGPRWVRQQHAADSLPLLVRPGTVVPLGARTTTPEYDYADGVVLRVVEPGDGARIDVVVPRGGERSGESPARFLVERDGALVRVHADGAPGAWTVEAIVGGRVVGPVSGDGSTDVVLDVSTPAG